MHAVITTALKFLLGGLVVKWLDQQDVSGAVLLFVGLVIAMVLVLDAIGFARIRAWGSQSERNRRMGAAIAFVVVGAVAAFGWWSITKSRPEEGTGAAPAVTPAGTQESQTPPPVPQERAVSSDERGDRPEQSSTTPAKEKAAGQSSSGSNSPNITVGPGGAVSIGQTGGITAGTVNLSADEKLVRSIAIKVNLDYPTLPQTPEPSSKSMGVGNVMAWFDIQKRRYRFASRNFEFEDYQLTETVHRVGFDYVPEEGNELVGSLIGALSQIEAVAFNFSDFFETVRPTALREGNAQLTMGVFVNGLPLIQYKGSLSTKDMLERQVVSSTSVFRDIEKAYVAAMTERMKR